jgi:Tol biopolymer transport system component
MNIKAIAFTILFLVSLTVLPAPAYSQELGAEIPMDAAQFRVRRLAPGVASEEAVFPLDSSNKVKVEIIADAGGLTTSIVTPGGQTINPSNVTSLGGTFDTIEGPAEPEGFLALTEATQGFHYIYDFPSQGAGNYTVRVESPTNPTADIAVLIHVNTDSNIRTMLFATQPIVVQGSPAVFSAAVFNGSTALAGATVAVEARLVSEPPVTPVNFNLLDDGGVADHEAGDGLYSGEFTPNTAGEYSVLAIITGTTPGGTAYTRHSLTRIRVVNPTSKFTGTVGDQGIDDNSDGLFDRIRLNIQTNTTLAGSYSVIAHLRTASGQTVIRGTKVDLATGIGTVPVDFEASAFVELGENGPYAITLIEMFHLGEEEMTPADRLENVGQTQAYTLVQLQRPPLVVTTPHVVTGIDTNANGKYDILRVQAQVLALNAGVYEWSGVLADAAGNEITFVSSFATFVVGSNTMTFNFNGSDIGHHGVSGAYTVKSVVLFGAGTSIIVDRLLDTQAFLYKEFENSDNLEVASVSIQEASGDGDGFVEPGENGSLNVQLKNIGGSSISGINATLSSLTPGVTVTSAQSTYPTVASQGTVTNNTPFTFSLTSEVPCGELILLKLTITHVGDGGIPSIINFSIQPGQPTTSSTFNYTGAPVAIPDAEPVGVNIPITVSGVSGKLKDLNFRFGGSSCSTTPGSTTVGLDHTFVGDLVVKLTSPSGTTVTLLNEPGASGQASSGNNFCNTLFDDEGGGSSIQNILPNGEPYSGTFTAAEALAAFRGEDPNGTWILNVSDRVAQDVGNVRQFSLLLQGLECATEPPKVLFRTNRDGNYEVYVMEDDGSNQTRITTTTNSDENRAFWSPNGEKIAVSTVRDGSNWWDIVVMNPDGSNRVNLTHNVAYEADFTWSPDSAKIAFESDRDGDFGLYVMNADGTGVTHLINTGGSDQPPAWSPTGSKIAYVSYVNSTAGKADIFVINPDGTNAVNLTQSDATELWPVWSPDGTKILFAKRVGSASNPFDLYVMNADGTGKQRLTLSGSVTAYDWSPDGTKIAFQATTSGNTEIYVMNADGSSVVNITNHSAADSSPQWSSDGLRILFTSHRSGNADIYVMNANGSGLVNLTANSAADQSPRWQPQP